METQRIEMKQTVETGAPSASKPERVVTPKIDIGGAMLNLDKQSYGAATAGAGATFNLGKGFTMKPEVNAAIGKDVKGIGGELVFAKSLNPRLTLNVGAGYEAFKFNKATTQETFAVAGGSDNIYDMGDGYELRNKGEYIYSGTVTETETTKSSQNRLYGQLGADYKLNDKWKLSGGLELGSKKISGPVQVSEQQITGYECTESASSEYIPEIGEYAVGSAKVTPFEYNNTEIKRNDTRAFTGNLKLGAEYKISEELSAGISGNIGLNRNSDNFVGAKVTYRF